jgi:glycosyltransferase involved in cell wall biosynthesis
MSPGMVSTAKRARALGYKTMVYAAIPEPVYSMRQIELEKRAFCVRSPGEDRSRYWRIQRFAAQLKVLDYIIALTDFCKQTYIDCGFRRDRIFVTPLGVDLRRFKPAALPPPGNCFTYIFVAHVEGTIGMLKGLQYLLQAWSELKLENSRLLVCGKLGEEAKQVINRYGDALENIELIGPVDRITAYYERASVFVFPSIAEGFGKVTLEAMATGRPVIVTPNSGAVARDGIDGFYVPPRDVNALKERMAFFYQHREHMQTMGANAAEQARKFTWERFGLQIADIVDGLSSN